MWHSTCQIKQVRAEATIVCHASSIEEYVKEEDVTSASNPTNSACILGQLVGAKRLLFNIFNVNKEK